MAKKIIPAQVLVQCMNLSLEQVAGAMDHGGAVVCLTSAKFMGMMPGGAFVYQCTGNSFKKVWAADNTYSMEIQEWPDYLAEFKIKLAVEKNHADKFKPAFQAQARHRMLSDEYIVTWGG